MTTMQWIGVAIGSALAILVHWSNTRHRRDLEKRLEILEEHCGRRLKRLEDRR